MATSKKRPAHLTRAEVTAIIRQCLSEGAVVPFPHFRSRGFQRRFTVQDAVNVLRFGEVSTESPEWDEVSGAWSYRVHGPDLEGDVLTVVVRIYSPKGRIWLVTAF
jgi:hypothetical protein